MGKKRYFNISLNDEPFIIDNKGGEMPVFTRWHYSNIFTAYKTPSQIKINIWEYWNEWLKELARENEHIIDYDLWIASRNGFQFTITGYFITDNCGSFGFHITKSKNECWKVIDEGL